MTAISGTYLPNSRASNQTRVSGQGSPSLTPVSRMRGGYAWTRCADWINYSTNEHHR